MKSMKSMKSVKIEKAQQTKYLKCLACGKPSWDVVSVYQYCGACVAIRKDIEHQKELEK